MDFLSMLCASIKNHFIQFNVTGAEDDRQSSHIHNEMCVAYASNRKATISVSIKGHAQVKVST